MTRALLGSPVLLIVAALACAQTQPRECAADNFLCGAPLTFRQVERAIGVIYEGRLREAIRRRGIAFGATGEELEMFRRAGASSALLDELKHATAPAPVALAPEPKPELEPGEKLALRILQQAAVGLNGTKGGAPLTVAGHMRTAASEPGWPFSARIRANGSLEEVEIVANGLRRVSFAEPGCALDGIGKAELPPEVEKGLLSFCQFQPAALVRGLRTGDFKRTVEGPLIPAGREWVLHAAGPGGSYELAFSHSLIPVDVKYQPSEPSGAAFNVRYSGYLPADAAPGNHGPAFPSGIVVETSGTAGGAAEFRIDTVAPDAANRSLAKP